MARNPGISHSLARDGQTVPCLPVRTRKPFAHFCWSPDRLLHTASHATGSYRWRTPTPHRERGNQLTSSAHSPAAMGHATMPRRWLCERALLAVTVASSLFGCWSPGGVQALLSPNFALKPCAATAPQQHNWTFVNQTLGGRVATNVVDNGMNHTEWVGTVLNCAGSNKCHAWGPGFGDRNGGLPSKRRMSTRREAHLAAEGPHRATPAFHTSDAPFVLRLLQVS